MKRLFVAIKVTPQPALNEFINSFQSSLKPFPLKWVETENIHFTLRFLGNTADEMVPSIITSLQSCAAATEPFKFEITNPGYFKERNNIRVLWLGIDDQSGLFKQCFDRIQGCMVKLGFPEEPKPFSPHLTLARVKKPVTIKAVLPYIEKHQGLTLQEVVVDSFQLFESQLTPKGPVYTLIQNFHLK